MAEVALASEGKPLSQTERVVDTFVAPSKTFTDLLRSASWWLPFIILVLGSYLLTFSIQQKVGWSQMADNQIRSQPKLQDRMSSMTPDQVATQHKVIQSFIMGGFYAAPVFTLVAVALMAVVLWPTINFGFGGAAKYSRVFALCMFAFLPGVLKSILASILLYAGRSPDSFTPDTMVGSNIGYYIETPGPLKTFLTSIDIFSIWTAILLSIGLAIVARTKRSSGYIAVFGWWILIILVSTAYAAVTT